MSRQATLGAYPFLSSLLGIGGHHRCHFGSPALLERLTDGIPPMATPDVPVVRRTIADGDTVPAVIGYHVMTALGRPKEFHRVDVHPLWKDHYRVNVVVGSFDSYSWRIAHSFFVAADANGKISSSIPQLQKCY